MRANGLRPRGSQRRLRMQGDDPAEAVSMRLEAHPSSLNQKNKLIMARKASQTEKKGFGLLPLVHAHYPRKRHRPSNVRWAVGFGLAFFEGEGRFFGERGCCWLETTKIGGMILSHRFTSDRASLLGNGDGLCSSWSSPASILECPMFFLSSPCFTIISFSANFQTADNFGLFYVFAPG